MEPQSERCDIFCRVVDNLGDVGVSWRLARQVAREHGKRVRRTMGFAHLGGATLDNEENYLIKKLFTALGAIQIENQARI